MLRRLDPALLQGTRRKRRREPCRPVGRIVRGDAVFGSKRTKRWVVVFDRLDTLSGMGKTNFHHSLTRRYAALTGELAEVRLSIDRIKREFDKLVELEERVPALERLIEGAQLLLQDADPDWEPEHTAAIKPWSHHIPVPFGSCGRRGMEVLRNAGVAMSVRQVAKQVLADVDCSEPDVETLRRTKNAIEASFRKFRGRTVESSGKYPAQWRAINKPQITFDP